MPEKGVSDLVWDMFEYSGSPSYYLFFKQLYGRATKNTRQEKIERMTR